MQVLFSLPKSSERKKRKAKTNETKLGRMVQSCRNPCHQNCGTDGIGNTALDAASRALDVLIDQAMTKDYMAISDYHHSIAWGLETGKIKVNGSTRQWGPSAGNASDYLTQTEEAEYNSSNGEEQFSLKKNSFGDIYGKALIDLSAFSGDFNTARHLHDSYGMGPKDNLEHPQWSREFREFKKAIETFSRNLDVDPANAPKAVFFDVTNDDGKQYRYYVGLRGENYGEVHARINLTRAIKSNRLKKLKESLMATNDLLTPPTPEEIAALPTETILARQLALTGLEWKDAEAILLPLLDNEEWMQDMVVWIADFWDKQQRTPEQQETMLHLFEIMDGESTTLMEFDRKNQERRRLAETTTP